MLLENCRSSGESDDVVMNCIRSKDFSSIQSRTREPMMDVVDRVKLAEEMDIDWEHILREGYYISFLHTNALKRLLHLRYGLEEENDYTQSHYHLLDVLLNKQNTEDLYRLISVQWNMEETEAGYKLAHKGFLN